MVKAVTLAACLLLSGCLAAKGSFCTVAAPIRPSAQAIAAMSDAEVRAVLANNVKGQKLCGWKP